MRKIVLLTGSFIILLFVNAFKLKENSALPSAAGSAKRNIISCGPGKNNYRKASFNYSFNSDIDSLEEIFANDNRRTAGEMKDGILYLKLESRTGAWYPETHDGKGLRIHAFAEAGKPLQLPGPLIRVPEGTMISAEIHNLIPGSPLVLHGFYSRPGNTLDSVIIPFGKIYKVQFKSGKAGTYLYWATDGTLKGDDDGLPYFDDSQLYGAFIVDPPKSKPDPKERIMMIGIWNDTLNGPTDGGEELVINGMTWPYTERLTYQAGEQVHWRLINASDQSHPMHLHGFYYTVNSRGNADTDNVYREKDRCLAVTELIKPHHTLSLTWTPVREGNWLFHCHTLPHIMAGSFLRNIPEMTEQQMSDITTHAKNGMGGLIMGITVLPSAKQTENTNKKTTAERKLTLIAQEQTDRFDSMTSKGFILIDKNNIPSAKQISIPGPLILLNRGEATAIKIINKLHEPTTVHWHGLEIESYFDGVSGWGNRGKELAPLIMPGDSFIAHLTPPRAGTFIYHTHMHNFQLMSGMYGPLIVMKPGEKFDPATDKVLLISSNGPGFEKNTIFLNGTKKPDTMQLISGVKYRLRLINITAINPKIKISIFFNKKPGDWRALAKDGADLSPQQKIMVPASEQNITIGETRDFEFQPNKPGNYFFEVRAGEGELLVMMVMCVK